jgi:hypothetical protein
MKLKNGLHNVPSIAALFLICSGFSHRPIPSEKLHGKWHYRAILKNGLNILSPDKDDTMFLNTEKSLFHYDIKSLNKHIGGTLQIISSPPDSSPYQEALMFQYKPSSEVRRFHIMLCNDDSLIIREGNTSFHYSRKKP